MSIDFSTLQGLTIPEGEVVKIEDGLGNVLWELQSNKPIILEVEKITSDTYAGETTYSNEEFILLDIYPKTNGTVKVTYGGLTKTITDTSGAEEPNAQQVYFGTFNGVSDEVETPASGQLTIKGDCRGFGCGYFKISSSTKSSLGYSHSFVTDIESFGAVEFIPEYAFDSINGNKLTMANIEIPKTVTSIGKGSFANSSMLETLTIGEGVTYIGRAAFNNCPNLTIVKVLGTTPAAMEYDTSYQIKGGQFGVIGEDDFVLEKIIVPKGCGDTYKTADVWSEYADYIVEAS